MILENFIDFTPEVFLLLFFIAVLAGTIDTLAGGGGLLTLPALLIAGVPPIPALATNKLQGCWGTATASFLLIRRGRIDFLKVRGLMLFAFFGSCMGTIALQFFPVEKLEIVIPIVISLTL
ncbi:MAG: TSUP family transporter, partial [Pseudomonadota bacterium]